MSDKEEIRWELDKVFEFVNWLITLHQNEQKTFQDSFEKTRSKIIKTRNGIMGSIGFGIGIVISLISIEALGRTELNLVVYGICASLAIFVGAQVLLYFVSKPILKINEAYDKDILELLEFKGWMLGLSLRENSTKERIRFLLNLSFVISQVIGYNMQKLSQLLLKTKIMELEGVDEAYEIAKTEISAYKKNNLKIIQTIDKFVDTYKKNEVKF